MVRYRHCAGKRNAELRGQARLVRRCRPRAQGRTRARRPHRPDIVLQVRDRGTWRARRARPNCRQSPRSARGSCVYTQLCNERGGIEADLTIMRLAPDRFYLVTGSAFGVRDAGWVRRHLPNNGSAAIHNVTSAFAVVNLVGPKARHVLSATTLDDVSNAAFPYLAVRDIEIGLARVRAARDRIRRRTRLGAAHSSLSRPCTSSRLCGAAGEAHGIADAGYRAHRDASAGKRLRILVVGRDPRHQSVRGRAWISQWRSISGDFFGRDALKARSRPGDPRAGFRL